MAAPDLAPPRTFGGIVAVWIVAGVAAIAIGLFVPLGLRSTWLVVAMGGCLILAFAVQLAYGRSQGFIQRIAASVLGALLVMGLLSLGFGLASIVPG